jgi:hypothetical protein
MHGANVSHWRSIAQVQDMQRGWVHGANLVECGIHPHVPN